MNCPCCGSPMPDGVTFCANCGNEANQFNSMKQSSAPTSPFSSVNDSLFNSPSQYTPQYNSSPAYSSKSSKGGMFAAIIAVVVILLIGVVYVTRFSTIPIAGTYKIDSFKAGGQEITISELDSLMNTYSDQIESYYSSYELQMVYAMMDLELEIKPFGKSEMQFAGYGGSIKVKVRGNKITLEAGGQKLDGTIDRKNKTLTIDFSPVTTQNVVITFKKK